VGSVPARKPSAQGGEMACQLRPIFKAGVVAVSASVLAFTSVVTPMPDTPVASASPTVASSVAVDLRAFSQQLIQELSATSSLSTRQLPNTALVPVTPTIAPSPPLINLANFIDWLYLAIEPWVRYAVDVAAYVASWFIPYFGWIIDNQVSVVYNSLSPSSTAASSM
jgi:hypothetical protein